MVAPASRGSMGESLASAASSACAAGSPPSRENPRDNSVPAASTMTAPTENAVSDGGHCHASETASRIHCSSPLSIREPYLSAAEPLSIAYAGERQQKADGPQHRKVLRAIRCDRVDQTSKYSSNSCGVGRSRTASI